MVTNAFSSSSASASVSYCPPICLDEVQQHVNDAKDALNDGNVVKAASELDIVRTAVEVYSTRYIYVNVYGHASSSRLTAAAGRDPAVAQRAGRHNSLLRWRLRLT